MLGESWRRTVDLNSLTLYVFLRELNVTPITSPSIHCRATCSVKLKFAVVPASLILHDSRYNGSQFRDASHKTPSYSWLASKCLSY